MQRCAYQLNTNIKPPQEISGLGSLPKPSPQKPAKHGLVNERISERFRLEFQA
jgi:hypothetical protein